MKLIKELLQKSIEEELSKEDITQLLSISDREELKQLFDAAYIVKSENVGNKVYFRGIIEFSNICKKDCYYCGIRKSNKNVERFIMKEEEILRGAKWAYENNYGSIVLQSGERDDKNYIDFITNIIQGIKSISNNKLGITLSLGEQTKEVYKNWFNSGAHRYLIRVETTNPKLYSNLHPADHDFEKRKKCLIDLREIGYQVGTGVMIGLPNQTLEDLANDILFFKEMDIDMIGMGPYLISENTPTADSISPPKNFNEVQYTLALKMISVTRLVLKDVNIASTTALQALKTFGREMGLKAGANIIMPNITDVKYRPNYQLYNDKPCTDENAEECIGCLDTRILNIEESVGYGEWGDSPHFFKKNYN